MSVQDDKELQRFLTADDPVVQAYRKLPSDDGPPAALDAAILAAAREEAKRPVRPRWLVPVSVAATVMLGVGLSVKQLSAPLQSASDDTYVPIPRDTDAPSPDRGATLVTPVFKPSLDALLEDDAEATADRAQVEVDTDALRKEALATQSFKIELDDVLSESLGGNYDQGSFAPPPETAIREQEAAPVAVQVPAAELTTSSPTARAPATPARGVSAQAPAAPAPPEPTVAQEPVTLEAKRASSDVQEALEQAKESEESFSSARRPNENLSRFGAQSAPMDVSPELADGIDQVVVTGHRLTTGDPTLSASEREIADQKLKRIARQWRLGRTVEAQTLFDEFIEDYPLFTLPDDFPLQRPDPEDAP